MALDLFAGAIHHFNNLLNQLAKEVGGDIKVDWVVEDMYAGSASATFRAVYDDAKVVEDVIFAYEKVGESLSLGSEIPYSDAVKRSARNLINILDGKITSIRFETPDQDYIVSGKFSGGERISPMKYSLGTVKGIVQTLSMRKRLSFTIWDSLFDKPVNCYLKEGEEENMRHIWGKRAVVSGRIGRQSLTGRPVVIRDVRYVRALEIPEPNSWKKAKGVIPWIQGDELPEDILRRCRDA